MSLGLPAALLFSTTFVVNRRMQLGGGAWEWIASLRYPIRALVPADASYPFAPGASRPVTIRVS